MNHDALSPPNRVSPEVVRRASGWLIVGVSLALIATAIDRSTTVEVYSDGGRLHLDVAGTSLVTPRVIRRLDAVEIFTMDSIDPPGGQRITVSDESGDVLREKLPRRFDAPPGSIVPVGDWELDEGAGWGSVWRRDVRVGGVFDVEAVFRGRFLHDLTLVLHGQPTTSIAIRRGLINNDITIRDAAGLELAGSSIDPTPVADLGAIGAILARSGAIAALLIAVFSTLRAVSRPRPLPAASRIGPEVLLVPVLAIFAVALSAWVARDVLEALPHTPDAVVYLLQADWLRAGSLWSEAASFQDYLTVPFTYVDRGRWLGHYPPGWPALLAAGVAVGLPWLVAPVLGGLYVVLIFIAGRELQSSALGLAAAALAVVSPMTRLMFAALLSHAFAATLIAAALAIGLHARRTGSRVAVASTGVVLGLAVGVRPLSAAAVAIPLLALTIRGRRDDDGRRPVLSTVLVFTGGFALAASPALAANALITGSPFSFPYSFARGSMFGISNIPFGLRNLDALLASDGAAATGWGWSWFHGPWTIALAFAPAVVALMTRRARRSDWLLAAVILCVAVASIGTRGHGLHGFGPRYHFEVYAPFFLLTARGFFVLAGRGDASERSERRLPIAAAFGLFFVLCMPAGATLPHRLALYRGYNGVDGELERQFERLDVERALIVLPTDTWQGWADVSRLTDLRPGSPVLAIQAEEDDPAIPEIAGDRQILLWRDGRLEVSR